MASEARKIVASVLGDRPTVMIWTGNYVPVIPFTPQGFYGWCLDADDFVPVSLGMARPRQIQFDLRSPARAADNS